MSKSEHTAKMRTIHRAVFGRADKQKYSRFIHQNAAHLFILQ